MVMGRRSRTFGIYAPAANSSKYNNLHVKYIVRKRSTIKRCQLILIFYCYSATMKRRNQYSLFSNHARAFNTGHRIKNIWLLSHLVAVA